MKDFIIKKYIISIMLIFISACLFVPSSFAVAAQDPSSISINTQPSSTRSVDSVLSTQPVLLVLDVNNKPVSGVAVTAFKASGKGNLKGSLTAITDLDGLATFQGLQYTKTDLFTVSFIYTGGSPVTSDSLQLSPGVASPTNSLITVTPSNIVSDGTATATIKIQCQDQYGNMIPGANVKVSVSGDNNSLSQSNSADSPGIVTINLSSTTAESKVISATVNGISIGNSSPIIFTPGKIAKLIISADTPVSTSQKSQITVTEVDSSGNIMTNDNSTRVVLSADNGGSLNSALISFLNGVASANLSKVTVGQVNLTASIGDIDAQTQIMFTSADNVAPIILSQYPLSSAQNVPINVIPYINFSKTMDISTLTTDNIELRNFLDNSIVSSEILVANGGKRVILQPDLNLNTNKKYYLYVNTSVSDSSGNSLSSVYISNPFVTTSDTQLSSTSQEQNIIKDIKDANTVGVTNLDSNAKSNGSVISNSAQQNDDVSGGNSSGSASDNLETGSSSITVTAGSSDSQVKKPVDNNIASYAEAGFLGVFKDLNINNFGDWFISNFIWIVVGIIAMFIIYLFWFFYIK